MKINIFYSWQSDKPKRVNLNLIQEATQLAIERIISDDEFQFEAALDRDTQDIPGSPAIAEAILSKIDQCSLFLCDVSIVIEPAPQRSSPNPNVLIELGYAAARIGWGKDNMRDERDLWCPNKLPFDLQHRRWCLFDTDWRIARGNDTEGRFSDTLRRSCLAKSIE